MTKEPLSKTEVVSVDSFAFIVETWTKHNRITEEIREICSCADCDLFRRISIDDLVISPNTRFIRAFFEAGGTAEELRIHHREGGHGSDSVG